MLFLGSLFPSHAAYDYLPEVKRTVVLASMHSFNPKSMTITFIGTPNTPGTLISRLNPERKTG